MGWHRQGERAVTVQPALTDLSLCPSESPAASVRWKDSAVCFKAAGWVFLDDRELALPPCGVESLPLLQSGVRVGTVALGQQNVVTNRSVPGCLSLRSWASRFLEMLSHETWDT